MIASRTCCIALLSVALAGCKTLGDIDISETDPVNETDGGDPARDADDDGFVAADDCDDDDQTIHPGADEVAYDGIDQDCDGTDLVDVDEDGFDASEAGGTDCDDTNVAVNPDAVELPGDGLDNDCSDATCFQGGFALTAVDWPVPDEYGAEAAAATAVLKVGSAIRPAEPIRFEANRPFVVVLYDTKTRLPLFVAQIADPRG